MWLGLVKGQGLKKWKRGVVLGSGILSAGVERCKEVGKTAGFVHNALSAGESWASALERVSLFAVWHCGI